MALDTSFVPRFLPPDPSAVFDIRVFNVTTTGMELEWQSTDNASEYTYHLVIQSERGSDKINTSRKEITLRGLVPGTLYNITIFPEVNHIQGEPSSTAQYTCKSLKDTLVSGVLSDSPGGWEASIGYTVR